MEPVLQKPPAPLIVPFCYFLAQGLLSAAAIYGTKPRSLVRLPTVAVILWLAYLEFISSVDFNFDGSGNGNITGLTFLYTAQLVNLLWLSNISMEDFKTAKIYAKGYTSGNSFLSVLHLVALNFRGIGTPWRTKNIPPFPAYYPGRTPQSRVQFLTRQTAIFVFQFLCLSLFVDQVSKMSPKDMHRLMGPGTELTYFSATREQWIHRAASSIGIWWVVNRCMVSALFNLISILGVASGIYSIEDYPPFIGRFMSSYTIRGFWGTYWHQALRWPHVALSTFITRDVLRLPKPSLLERYANIFVAFTLSAIFHTFINIGNGKEWIQMFCFFQSFGLAIPLEDAVQALWRRISGDSFAYKDEDVPMWKKIVGFIWVFFYFSAVAPWHIYPAARGASEGDVTMPFGEKTTATVLAVLGPAIVLVFKPEI